jgi:hypothetical protein
MIPELMNELVQGADKTHQSLTGLFIWKPVKAMQQESGWNAKVFRLVLQNNAFIIHLYFHNRGDQK